MEMGIDTNVTNTPKLRKPISKAPIVYFLFEAIVMTFIGLVNDMLYQIFSPLTIIFWVVTIVALIFYLFSAVRSPGFVLSNIYKAETELSMDMETKKENIIERKIKLGSRRQQRNFLIRGKQHSRKEGNKNNNRSRPQTSMDAVGILEEIGKGGFYSEESSGPSGQDIIGGDNTLSHEGIQTHSNQNLSPSEIVQPSNICLPTAEISISFSNDTELRTFADNLKESFELPQEEQFKTPQKNLNNPHIYKKEFKTDFSIPTKQFDRSNYTDNIPKLIQFSSSPNLVKGNIMEFQHSTQEGEKKVQKSTLMQGKTYSDVSLNLSHVNIEEFKSPRFESNVPNLTIELPQISVPRTDLQDEVLSEEDEEKTTPKTTKLEIELRYCTICHIEQPLRCKHCKECNHCIATYDHHCQWIGNCIGEKNRLFFLLFTIFEFLHIVFGFIIVIFSFSNHENWLQILYYNWYKAMLLLLIFYFLLMLLSLLIFHSYLAINNLTTWENLSWEKISYLNPWPIDLGSPFDKGCFHNLRLFFCVLCRYPFYIWKMPKTLPINKRPSYTVSIWGKCWNKLCNQ